MTDQIAFIGVGNMGNPMADQLVKAGKKVKAYDVSPEMIKKAKDVNLDVVDTLAVSYTHLTLPTKRIV